MGTISIDMKEINVMSDTFNDGRITIFIDGSDSVNGDDVRYRVSMSQTNARWLSEALKRAVKLSKMGCD